MNGLETMVDLAGQNVVLSYAGIESEYEALHRRAIVVNRSHRARMRFAGDKAAEVLTGLVTNDVTSLQVGQGQYAAALTAKGKVVADLRIDRKSTRLNSSHLVISYAVFCLKKTNRYD